METTGIIKKVARGGKSLQLDTDEWYSGWDAVSFKEGDTVKITFENNTKDGKTFHNWTNVELVNSAPATASSGSKESSFLISYAKDLLVAGWKPDEAIIAINGLRDAFK